MPRYFFDLVDHETSADETGTELPDRNHARIQAVTFAAEYLKDHPELVWDGQEQRVMVREGEDGVIFTLVVLAVDCHSPAVQSTAAS